MLRVVTMNSPYVFNTSVKNLCQEIPMPNTWLIKCVNCEDRPCTDMEIFLMTNFPDGPITIRYEQNPPEVDRQSVINSFNKSDTAIFLNLYAIDAKLVNNVFQV